MRYKGKHVHTISESDVGKMWITINGKTRLISDFLGSVLPCDVGKWVMEDRGVLQVESDNQRAFREAWKASK